ncbi:hypothetical protein MIMGU_mgv1a017332mg [Erythranthe guttata]|uniref:Uncharacterized protein n=1 Tax=Erythranthe guttata TaxID=4155 RepID=A0A022Q0F9_ERYGU|nr:hypothetical protein MIMGU_mgv1a017332mg [Erythranthe guttata]
MTVSVTENLTKSNGAFLSFDSSSFSSSSFVVIVSGVSVKLHEIRARVLGFGKLGRNRSGGGGAGENGELRMQLPAMEIGLG